MGMLELFIYIIMVTVLAWLATYVLRTLVPGHPPIIDQIVWGVAVLSIIVIALNALGILGHDPKIPQIK